MLEGERDRFATGAAAMARAVSCKLLVRTAVHRADALTTMRVLKISSFRFKSSSITQVAARWDVALQQSLPRFYKA